MILRFLERYANSLMFCLDIDITMFWLLLPHTVNLGENESNFL